MKEFHLWRNRKDYLLKLLEEENTRREESDDIQLRFLGDEKNTKETTVNVYDAELWSVSSLSSLLREAGVRTRVAGRELDKLALISRIRQILTAKEARNIYIPSPFGINYTEFWLPLLLETMYLVATVIISVVGVDYCYKWTETKHSEYDCTNFWKRFTFECYGIKKARSFLEELNYNVFYTIFCSIGIFMSKFLLKSKGMLDKVLNP